MATSIMTNSNIKSSHIHRNRDYSSKRKETSEYFKINVDPIFSQIISQLILYQPNNITEFLLVYLTNQLNNITDTNDLSLLSNKDKIDHKVYFTQYISPIITLLIKKIITNKPNNIIQFLFDEIPSLSIPTPSIIAQDSTTDTHPKVLLPTILNEEDPVTDTTTIQPIHTSPRPMSLAVTSSISRLKLEEAKSFADTLLHTNNNSNTNNTKISARSNSSSNIITSARLRNKIENAIELENTIINQPDFNMTMRESIQLASSNSNKHLSAHISSSSKLLNYSLSIPALDTTSTHPSTSTATATTTTTTTTIASEQPQQQPAITIQIAMLGIDKSGKTTILNTLQNISDIPRATIGFRPVTLFLDTYTKVQFFDLGGGVKIRYVYNIFLCLFVYYVCIIPNVYYPYDTWCIHYY